MAKPVKNWQSHVGDTPIFGDVADGELQHYGPRAVWRELTRANLGKKKVVFRGIIDLGYNSAELKVLLDGIAGKRIAPLALTTVSEQPSLGVAISPPHVGGLIPLNSLPFPQYQIAVTIDLEAPDAPEKIKELEDGWAARSLLKGRFSASADGVAAKGGFKVKIDAKSCISAILAKEGRRDLPKTAAWTAVNAAVQAKAQEWVAYYGAAEQPDDAVLAQLALVNLLVDRCFDDRVVLRYDNGVSATISMLREAASMADAENRTFILSSPAKVEVNIEF